MVSLPVFCSAYLRTYVLFVVLHLSGEGYDLLENVSVVVGHFPAPVRPMSPLTVDLLRVRDLSFVRRCLYQSSSRRNTPDRGIQPMIAHREGLVEIVIEPLSGVDFFSFPDMASEVEIVPREAARVNSGVISDLNSEGESGAGSDGTDEMDSRIPVAIQEMVVDGLGDGSIAEEADFSDLNSLLDQVDFSINNEELSFLVDDIDLTLFDL